MVVSPENLSFLREQVRNARLILFTGAGFSADAEDRTGKKLPAGDALAREIWALCYPGEPFEEGSNLQDLYQTAVTRRRRELEALMLRRLTVDAQSLPEHYSVWFSIPWRRIYTLNVDDLVIAAARKFGRGREPVPVSGTRDPHRHVDSAAKLEVIHLNGSLEDVPDHVTFSTAHYGRRLALQDPVYHRLVSDLASHPFIFVGTKLDESVLWQHIELRGERGVRGLKELRPRSFIISKWLSRPRRDLLHEYNVDWVEGTASEFAEVFRGLPAEAEEGARVLSRTETRASEIRLASDLVAAANTAAPSFFLLGSEPDWADLVTGKAVKRTSDDALLADARKMVADAAVPPPGVVTKKTLVVTGTAGCGKSTALMRVALGLTADGLQVAWVGPEFDVSLRDIRHYARRADAPPVLAIDDADRYGADLVGLVNDLQQEPQIRLIALGLRSTKLDRALNPGRMQVPAHEYAIPGLTDGDIVALLDALERDNKLGVLRGVGVDERIKAFRDQAGRQLLVAMMQATTGKRFEEKIVEEWNELRDVGRSVYALVALATSLRYSLSKDEVLLGVGGLGGGTESNETLNALSDLIRRHVVLAGTDGASCRARHRRIAEVLIDELQKSGRLGPVFAHLAFVAATKVSDALPRSARPWRLLKTVINHELLFRRLGLEDARRVYEVTENVLDWDYHYLLQRGCLEVEEGDVRLAENYVGQAYSLAPSDALVATEYAYMLFRKAIDTPGASGSTDLVSEAIAILEDQIRTRGERDFHPYHVLGSQGLAWARRGGFVRDEKERFLRMLLGHLDEGLKRHPGRDEAVQLHGDVKREWLGMRVASRP